MCQLALRNCSFLSLLSMMHADGKENQYIAELVHMLYKQTINVEFDYVF